MIILNVADIPDQNLESTYFAYIFLINVLSYLYILIKFYKVLCYSKITFEWLPMINPYDWPFSFFQAVTNPYFAFWAKILPSLKFEKSSLEISSIVGLEALNAAIYFCVRLVNGLVVLLKEIEILLSQEVPLS
jgi:uncharacterized protein YggT (Ycf19 family)